MTIDEEKSRHEEAVALARRGAAVKVALSRLQNVMATLNEVTQTDVAAVLRALRGPDSENYRLKQASTMRIRQAAFGKLGWIFGDIDEGRVKEFEIERALSGGHLEHHFLTAARRAAELLGVYDAD